MEGIFVSNNLIIEWGKATMPSNANNAEFNLPLSITSLLSISGIAHDHGYFAYYWSYTSTKIKLSSSGVRNDGAVVGAYGNNHTIRYILTAT